jgi:hypothetical protein
MVGSFGCSTHKTTPPASTTKADKPQVSPTEQEISGPPTWHKRAGLVMLDVTEKVGLQNVSAVHWYAVDFNHDGATDLIALNDFYAIPDFYLFNRKNKKFELMVTSPLPKNFYASFIVVEDFDNDQVLDLILVTLHQKTDFEPIPMVFLKGEIYVEKQKKKNIRYHEITPSPLSILGLPTSAVSVIDFNLDGHLDLFLANWYSPESQGKASTPDLLFMGNGKWEFKNASHLLYLEDAKADSGTQFLNARPTFGSSTCDINQDGRIDILTTSSNGFNNKLWINHYNRTRNQFSFQDLGEESQYAKDLRGRNLLTGGGNSFFSGCADYNSDGLVDVFVGEQTFFHDHENVDRSSVLTGSVKGFVPTFLRTEYSYGESVQGQHQGDRRAVWVDLNFDGRIDLLVENSGFPPHSRLVYFEQQPDRSFVNRAMEIGIDLINPAGIVTLDYNQDGKMDVLSGQTSVRDGKIQKRVWLFENKMSVPAGSLRFRVLLKGQKKNLNAVGASVSLVSNRETKWQFYEFSQGSLPSKNEVALFFALAPDENPLYFEVLWPKMNSENEIIKKKYLLDSKILKSAHQIELYEDGTYRESLL